MPKGKNLTVLREIICVFIHKLILNPGIFKKLFPSGNIKYKMTEEKILYDCIFHVFHASKLKEIFTTCVLNTHV